MVEIVLRFLIKTLLLKISLLKLRLRTKAFCRLQKTKSAIKAYLNDKLETRERRYLLDRCPLKLCSCGKCLCAPSPIVLNAEKSEVKISLLLMLSTPSSTLVALYGFDA
jgi:hypothetical protein